MSLIIMVDREITRMLKAIQGNSGNAIKEIVVPAAGEPVFEKRVNSAFIGKDLKEQLEKKGIKKVVIAG